MCRELTSTAQAFLTGFEDLIELYDNEKDKHPGKLPVVAVNKTIPRTNRQEHEPPARVRDHRLGRQAHRLDICAEGR